MVKFTTNHIGADERGFDLVSACVEAHLATEELHQQFSDIVELETIQNNLQMCMTALKGDCAEESLKLLNAAGDISDLLGIVDKKLTVKAAQEGLGQAIIDGVKKFIEMIVNFFKKIGAFIKNMFSKGKVESDKKQAEEVKNAVTKLDDAAKQKFEMAKVSTDANGNTVIDTAATEALDPEKTNFRMLAPYEAVNELLTKTPADIVNGVSNIQDLFDVLSEALTPEGMQEAKTGVGEALAEYKKDPAKYVARIKASITGGINGKVEIEIDNDLNITKFELKYLMAITHGSFGLKLHDGATLKTLGWTTQHIAEFALNYQKCVDALAKVDVELNKCLDRAATMLELVHKNIDSNLSGEEAEFLKKCIRPAIIMARSSSQAVTLTKRHIDHTLHFFKRAIDKIK